MDHSTVASIFFSLLLICPSFKNKQLHAQRKGYQGLHWNPPKRIPYRLYFMETSKHASSFLQYPSSRRLSALQRYVKGKIMLFGLEERKKSPLIGYSLCPFPRILQVSQRAKCNHLMFSRKTRRISDDSPTSFRCKFRHSLLIEN